MKTGKRIVERAVKEANDRGKLVFMGNPSGVVAVPGELGKVYVTDQNGHISKVWNAKVPEVAGHAAFVKRVDKRMQVTELWDVYTDFIYPKVGPHHLLHEWGAVGTDIVRVWGDVFMPWKIEPVAVFTVRIYRSVYITSTNWLPAGAEDVVITPWTSPAGSGIYVLLSVDVDGIINTTYGSGALIQADYNDLTAADIPPLPAGDKALFAIRLYEGQTFLGYNPTVSDFVDLRHLQSGGGGGGTPGTDSDAIHVNVDDEIIGIAEKTTPVGADVLVIEDSESSYSKKRLQMTNLPSGTVDASIVTYTPTVNTDWNSNADPGNADDAFDQLAARIDDLELALPEDASALTYTPAANTDWDSDTDPGNVDDALDQLASRMDDLEATPPGGITDASDLTYTPAVNTDWDSNADPGNADDAFDQLAARIDDLEAAGGSIGFQTLTDTSTIDWDLSLGSGRVTLAGDRLLNTPTNFAAGTHYFLCVVQDATGSRVLTYDPAGFMFPNNTPPLLSTGKNRQDVLSFECDGNYLFYVGIMKHVMNTTPDPGYSDNMVLWFAANEEAYVDNGVNLCANNDTVYRWGDQSDNAFDAIQTTGGSRPTFKTGVINGLPVIRFDGAASILPIIHDLAGIGNDLSFFMVVKPSSTTPVGIFDSGDEDSIRQFDAGYWEWYGNSPEVDMALANTDPVLMEFIHTLSPNRDVKYYKNGTYISDNPTGDSDVTLWENKAALGSINFGYTYYEGDIAEFILFKEALGTTNRQAVETYLKTKYGIA